jgi:hypothetical protein
MRDFEFQDNGDEDDTVDYKNQVVVWFNYIGKRDTSIIKEITAVTEELNLWGFLDHKLEELLGIGEDGDYNYDENSPTDEEIIEYLEACLKDELDKYIDMHKHNLSQIVLPYYDGMVEMYVEQKTKLAHLSSRYTFDASQTMMRRWTAIARTALENFTDCDINLIIYVIDLVNITSPIKILKSYK